MPFRSGFVSILGRPNAGKSTLLNRMVGSKVAIVSDKPQTTRQVLQGVVNRPEAQIVFLDTPGIHKAASKMNRMMMDEVEEALQDRDVLLLVVDATASYGPGDAFALELVKRVEEIAKEHNCTAAQLALAWVLAQGDDIVPIPGTRHPERVEENLRALDIVLSENDLLRIDAAAPKGAAAGARYSEQGMKTING